MRRWRSTTWPTSSTSTIPSPPPMRARDAIDLSVRSGDVYVLGTSVANLVIALAATADWDEADDVINRQSQRGTCSPTTNSSSRRTPGSARCAAMRTSPTSCSAKLNDAAGERGPPGHRHGGHGASVRGDGAPRSCGGAALEPHLRRAGRAGPVLRRRRRTVGVAAGRPVCPRARRSHRRGGAARHLRAAPARAARTDAARRSAADPRPPRRRASRPPTPPTNSSLAVEALRSISTPYHLAHGLLDHAEFLAAAGDSGGGRAGRSPRHDRSPPARLPAAARSRRRT